MASANERIHALKQKTLNHLLDVDEETRESLERIALILDELEESFGE